MVDLKNPNWIVFKGVLFLILGIMSATFLVIMVSRLDVAVLLVIAIWAFCRFYFFAFYVIEKYVDSEHKFDGLYATFFYLIRKTWIKDMGEKRVRLESKNQDESQEGIF